MDNQRLTLADQVLIWSSFALVSPAAIPGDMKMFGDIIRDVMPHVSRSNGYVDKVAVAALAVIQGEGLIARFDLESALRDVARVRAGLAYDAFAARSGGSAA